MREVVIINNINKIIKDLQDLSDVVEGLTPSEGGGGVLIYNSFNDFPNVGDENVLYLAKSDNMLYYYTVASQGYFNLYPLNLESSIDVINNEIDPIVTNLFIDDFQFKKTENVFKTYQLDSNNSIIDYTYLSDISNIGFGRLMKQMLINRPNENALMFYLDGTILKFNSNSSNNFFEIEFRTVMENPFDFRIGFFSNNNLNSSFEPSVNDNAICYSFNADADTDIQLEVIENGVSTKQSTSNPIANLLNQNISYKIRLYLVYDSNTDTYIPKANFILNNSSIAIDLPSNFLTKNITDPNNEMSFIGIQTSLKETTIVTNDPIMYIDFYSQKTFYGNGR